MCESPARRRRDRRRRAVRHRTYRGIARPDRRSRGEKGHNYRHWTAARARDGETQDDTVRRWRSGCRRDRETPTYRRTCSRGRSPAPQCRTVPPRAVRAGRWAIRDRFHTTAHDRNQSAAPAQRRHCRASPTLSRGQRSPSPVRRPPWSDEHAGRHSPTPSGARSCRRSSRLRRKRRRG